MLGRYRQLRKRLHQIMDAGLFAIAFWIAHFVRSTWTFGRPPIFPFTEFLWLFGLILVLTPLILDIQGFYSRPLLSARRMVVIPLVRGSLIMTAILIFAIFLSRQDLARAVVFLFCPISFLFVFLKEEFIRVVYKSRFGQEQIIKHAILAGTTQDTVWLKEQLQRRARFGLKIIAEIDLNRDGVDKLINLLHEFSANCVIFSARHTYYEQVEKAVKACAVEGVEAWLVADFFKVEGSRTSLDELYGIPMLVYHSTPSISWQLIAKQLIDYIGALFLLILCMPLFIVVGILIKLTSPGPVFFKQLRCGLNGKPFMMYKFRSMISNAEQLKHELEVLNEMSGPVFKITNDPRVTRVGKFLRKFSLDELPQLINVLKGEMSLVGPRPLPVDEVKRFDDYSHRRRLSVKPGLTCLWQISGRSEVTDFNEWVRLDLQYIDNWSLWLDLKILWKTIPVVLLAKGAK
ncbi:MAG: sugar transferase [Verrucomicrobiae bacterium]|nr:sugar transferase [Verrucomicrobiae bacterium]